MAKSSGHCAQIDAGGKQLGRAVVPNGVQVGVDAELVDHAGISVGHSARTARAGVVGRVGEDEALIVEPGVELGAAGYHPLGVFNQQGHGLGIERDAPAQVWRDELEAAIRASTLAVLLVSRHFLESEFIMREELTALEECGVPRLPVLVGECDWAAEPRLERLQWIHDPRVALGAEGRTVRASKRGIVRICRRVATRLEETQREAIVPSAQAADDVAAIEPSGRAGGLSDVPLASRLHCARRAGRAVQRVAVGAGAPLA